MHSLERAGCRLLPETVDSNGASCNGCTLSHCAVIIKHKLCLSEGLLTHWPEGTALPLPRWLLHRYWVIQHLYDQQSSMFQTKTRRCDDRIVSISQPYVRPIVRGKQNKSVEFGAKLSVSLTGDGFARVDHLRWNAFHEGLDLKSQVEAYHQRTGHYPEKVLADPL